MEIAEISCLPEGAGTLVFRAAGANASRRSQLSRRAPRKQRSPCRHWRF